MTTKDLAGKIAMVDLPAVIEAAGVTLTKQGSRYSGLCPFHPERTPSFSVYGHSPKWRFKCFGCGAGGDVIDFVQMAHKLDFQGALAFLGISPGPRTPELSERIRRNQKKAELLKAFKTWRDRQIDVVCFVIHVCNRHVRKIKNPDDLERFGGLYHLLAKAEYSHEFLCEASDRELHGLFRGGGYG